MRTRRSTTVLTMLLARAGHAFAEVQPPGIISDHMRLPREMPARLFGTAQPGAAVRPA